MRSCPGPVAVDGKGQRAAADGRDVGRQRVGCRGVENSAGYRNRPAKAIVARQIELARPDDADVDRSATRKHPAEHGRKTVAAVVEREARGQGQVVSSLQAAERRRCERPETERTDPLVSTVLSGANALPTTSVSAPFWLTAVATPVKSPASLSVSEPLVLPVLIAVSPPLPVTSPSIETAWALLSIIALAVGSSGVLIVRASARSAIAFKRPPPPKLIGPLPKTASVAAATVPSIVVPFSSGVPAHGRKRDHAVPRGVVSMTVTPPGPLSVALIATL